MLPETLIGRMWFLLENYTIMFVEGIIVTLVLAILGTLFGLIIGSVVVLLRTGEIHYKDNLFKKVLKKTGQIIAKIYVDVLRGTPMIVQAAVFFYGMAALGHPLNPMRAGIIIVSVNSGAYITEILRSGINSLDKGQMEAARSLGMSRNLAFFKIIVPQVYKNTMPSLMNELIVNVKDTSVLSTIGVTELYYSAKGAASEFYLYFEAMLLCALIYLFLTKTLTFICNKILERSDKKYARKSKKVAIASQTVPEVS